MTVIATGEIDLRLSPASQSRLENDITGATKKASTKASGQFSSAFGGAAAAIGGAFAAVGSFKILGSFLTEATEAAKVGRDTAAVIKSMGDGAGTSVAGIENLATKLSTLAGVDDDLIQANLNVLATFGNIKNTNINKTFDQAALAALNLSARMGGDLQGATVQIGKALNDPIKGITALSRAGVSFTDQQKKMIKKLVETGDTLGAQKIILSELTKQFGGAAEAAATPAAKLKVAFDNVKESLGTALLPVVQKISDIFLNMSPGMQKVVVVAGLVVGAVALLAPVFLALGPVIAGVGAALAFLVSPIGLVVAAVALLAIVIVKNWDTINAATQVAWQAIQSAVTTAWETIKTVVSGAIDFITFLFENFTGPGILINHWETIRNAAVTVFNAVRGIVTGVVDLVRGLPRTIMTFFAGIGGWLVSAGADLLRGFINGIRSMAGKLISAITETITGHLPGFVKKALGIKSPSSVFFGFGANVVQGFVDGIESGLPQLDAVVAQMVATPAFGNRGFGGNSSIDTGFGSDSFVPKPGDNWQWSDAQRQWINITVNEVANDPQATAFAVSALVGAASQR